MTASERMPLGCLRRSKQARGELWFCGRAIAARRSGAKAADPLPEAITGIRWPSRPVSIRVLLTDGKTGQDLRENLDDRVTLRPNLLPG